MSKMDNSVKFFVCDAIETVQQCIKDLKKSSGQKDFAIGLSGLLLIFEQIEKERFRNSRKVFLKRNLFSQQLEDYHDLQNKCIMMLKEIERQEIENNFTKLGAYQKGLTTMNELANKRIQEILNKKPSTSHPYKIIY